MIPEKVYGVIMICQEDNWQEFVEVFKTEKEANEYVNNEYEENDGFDGFYELDVIEINNYPNWRN